MLDLPAQDAASQAGAKEHRDPTQPDHRCRRRPGRARAGRPPGLRRHRDRVRGAGGRQHRCTRRRPRHARGRRARAGRHRRAHRRHRLVGRLGLRSRSRRRHAGLAARARPRLCGAQRPGADRAGRDPVRPARRRRQELGPLRALSGARLCGGRERRRRIRARQRRGRLGGHHARPQGWHRVGGRHDPGGSHGRRASPPSMRPARW